MSTAIGMDIGGTKIAGALFDEQGEEILRAITPTPKDYPTLLEDCRLIIAELDAKSGARPTIGVGIPAVAHAETEILPHVANIPCLGGHNLRRDLEASSGRPVFIANDANCAALSEAIDGAGAGCRRVFGLIMGTGVGGGLILDGHMLDGANGFAGEIGHLPLPFREESDGPVVKCVCGQMGCIDKSASGPALARFWQWSQGSEIEIVKLAERARAHDPIACDVLDRFYTVVAKAMVTVIHAYDPDIIVVSGGLNNLPGMYETVPERWKSYIYSRDFKTKFVPAKLGAMSGMRGAAWLGRQGA